MRRKMEWAYDSSKHDYFLSSRGVLGFSLCKALSPRVSNICGGRIWLVYIDCAKAGYFWAEFILSVGTCGVR